SVARPRPGPRETTENTENTELEGRSSPGPGLPRFALSVFSVVQKPGSLLSWGKDRARLLLVLLGCGLPRARSPAQVRLQPLGLGDKRMASRNHVENPFEFVIEKLGWAASDIGRAVLPNPTRHIGEAVPVVQKITVSDLWDSLKKGVADVGALRDDILFIGLIYPLAG